MPYCISDNATVVALPRWSITVHCRRASGFSVNTIVRLPASGSAFSTTDTRTVFPLCSKRVTVTPSVKLIGSRSKNQAGVDLRPTLVICFRSGSQE